MQVLDSTVGVAHRGYQVLGRLAQPWVAVEPFSTGLAGLEQHVLQRRLVTLLGAQDVLRSA